MYFINISLSCKDAKNTRPCPQLFVRGPLNKFAKKLIFCRVDLSLILPICTNFDLFI